MKKILSTVLVLVAFVGFGVKALAVSPYDYEIMTRNAANNGNTLTYVTYPRSGIDGFVGNLGSTSLPTFFTIGSNLSIAHPSNVISAILTGQPESNITNLTSDLASKFTLPSGGTTGQFIDGTGALQTLPSASAVWGTITGTLSSQTDLSSALALKANTSSLSTVATTGAYSDLTGKPSLFSGAFSALTGIPTTLAGYGITDAYPLSGNPSGFLTGITSSQIAAALGFTPYSASNPNSYITASALASYATTASLGSAAFQPSSAFATSAQGTLAASAVQPAALSGYVPTTTTVNGHALSANVTVSANDVGLGNVNNTSDANKPVSTAQAASIATKLTIPTGTTSQVVLGNGTLGTLPVVPTLISSFTNDAGYLTNATLPAYTYNYTPTHTIQTVAAAANGWQISSSASSVATYSVTITTTATIAGSQQGYVVMEIAPTNSTTASDWKEVARVTNGQSLSLAVALQSVQPIGGQMMGVIPAGYYVRLRSVNVSGTPTYTYNSGEEIVL